MAFTGHRVRFTVFKLVILIPFLKFWSYGDYLVIISCEHAFKAFERIQCTRETALIILSRIIPNVWTVLRVWVPKTQTTQNQICQRKTQMKESLFQANWLIQRCQFPRGVNPSAASGRWPWHKHLLAQLKKIIKGYLTIKNNFGHRV